MKKRITISVGTSAYNEEQNIKNMLKSVLKQKGGLFVIKEILVVSDGSTDSTVKKAKSIKDKRITVFDKADRLGKPSRVNFLIKNFSADLLILIDSDMVLRDSLCLERMASEFLINKNLGMAAGTTLPLPAQTFMEAAIGNFLYCRRRLESLYSFKKTAFSVHSFIAMSRKFAEQIQVPVDVVNDDTYCYFMCLKKKFDFACVDEACVFYRTPQTVRDYINQALRWGRGGEQLKKIFGQKMFEKGYFVPRKYLILLMLKQIIRNPFGYAMLRIVNSYVRLLQLVKKGQIEVKWETIATSKKLFTRSYSVR